MAVCYKFLKQINDFIDNDIEPSDLKQLETHLQNCSSCRAYVNRYKTVKKSLAALPHYKTSQTFDIVLRERLRKEINGEKRFHFKPFVLPEFPMRVPSIAGAGIAVVIAAFLIVNSLSDKKVTPNGDCSRTGRDCRRDHGSTDIFIKNEKLCQRPRAV